MASRRDYGQKRSGKAASRNQQRKPAANSRKARPVKRKRTGLKAMVALTLLGAMGYLLYSLVQGTQQQYVPKPQIQAPAKPAPKPAPRKEPARAKAEQAPQEVRTVDEPRFEFYQMLEKSEVNTEGVDAYRSTPKGQEKQYRYLLQAGSFRKHSDAEQLRAKLILMGLPNAKTSKSDGKNGIWYRVQVGPFDNRSLMNRAQDKLVKIRLQPLEIKLDN